MRFFRVRCLVPYPEDGHTWRIEYLTHAVDPSTAVTYAAKQEGGGVFGTLPTGTKYKVEELIDNPDDPRPPYWRIHRHKLRGLETLE